MGPSIPYGDKTLPLSVANLGFLLDRLGQDCHPLQFLRELTQNSIEAIARTSDKSGQVVWDVDWTTFDLHGTYKLTVVDTGDGMSGDEMVRYINQLSSSISGQSIRGNYGIGAKVAAATRNHEGLIYLSWKDGRGSMVHLWRNPTTGEYGLRQHQRPDGSFGHWAEIEDDVKPVLIDEHGTMVVLMGNSQDADTLAPPEGSPSPSRWIAKYLNSRYFDFLPGIEIRAREGWMNPREDQDRNLLRRVVGQRAYLEDHSEASGMIDIPSASAHWWILRDENALSSNSGYIESSGHTAVLFDNELYEVASGRAGMASLQQFGVILGHRRVVIYVEPETGQHRQVASNTARTHILIDNEPVPWTEWAAAFRDQMPQEIEDLIAAVAAGAKSSDHSDTIRDRLKQILDLFKVSRYRPTPTGSHEADSDATIRGGLPKKGQVRALGGSNRAGKRGGTAGGVYSVFLKKGGTKAEQAQPDPFPDVIWICIEDGTREPGDLEDRAARYLIDQNRMLVNADFRVFEDMVKYWMKLYPRVPRESISDAVYQWFQMHLTETVLGIQAIRNSQEWSVDDIEKALSEEALTAAVMPRWHVNVAIKRELGSKFGKIAAA